MLNLVELDGLGGRYPSQLSGGQRQRVALARALAVSPEVLVLDEPFGALDATVRKSLRKELRRIHNATGVTTIFVTHDQEEALELADRVAILNFGKIEQVGTPTEVYDNPASAFVCGFVGEANRFEGQVKNGQFVSGAVRFATEAMPGPKFGFVRPHDLTLSQGGEPGFQIRIERVIAQGPVIQVEAQTLDNRRIDAAFARQDGAGLAAGATIGVTARKAHVFPAA